MTQSEFDHQVDLHEEFMKSGHTRGHRLSLCGHDLAALDMQEYVLDGIDLFDCILSGAALNGAKISNSLISGCSFRGAKLRAVSMPGTYLRNNDFRDADLTCFDFSPRVCRGNGLLCLFSDPWTVIVSPTHAHFGPLRFADSVCRDLTSREVAIYGNDAVEFWARYRNVIRAMIHSNMGVKTP